MQQDGLNQESTPVQEHQLKTSLQSSTPALAEESFHDGDEHKPRRAKKKLLLDDNEGDFRVVLIHPGGPAFSLPSQPELPKGTLIPLLQFPGFHSTLEAERHIKKRASQSSEMLSGSVIAIIRYSQVIRLEVAQAVQVTMARKPKRAVDAGPATE
jgi:hypothetical protein